MFDMVSTFTDKTQGTNLNRFPIMLNLKRSEANRDFETNLMKKYKQFKFILVIFYLQKISWILRRH